MFFKKIFSKQTIFIYLFKDQYKAKFNYIQLTQKVNIKIINDINKITNSKLIQTILRE